MSLNNAGSFIGSGNKKHPPVHGGPGGKRARGFGNGNRKAKIHYFGKKK